jgi:hypothetical protein
MLVSTLIGTIHTEANIQVDSNETTIAPIVFGNASISSRQQTPNDVCVSSDGKMFSVSFLPLWQLIRGSTPASIVAWGNDGNVLWSHTTIAGEQVLYQIATDDQYVFATGAREGNLFLAKYDLLGRSILNASWDQGGDEEGKKMALLEDGTFVIGGRSIDSSGNTTEYFLVTFDQNGQIRWYETYSEFPYFSCYSNSIYIITNSTLQKRTSSGVIEWSTHCDEGVPACINNQLLYILDFPENTVLSYFGVTKWNLTTQASEWSFDYIIRDADNETYDSNMQDYSVTQNGSLMILNFIYDLGKSYLLTVNQEGSVTSCINIYDGRFFPTCLDVNQDDRVHVAGTSDGFGQYVAVYDLEHPLNPNNGLSSSDFQTVTIVVVAVILFDTGFIIYLRKRYGR